MRFLSPILFAGAAVWVHVYNGSHTDRVIVLPFVEMAPGAASDPARQGEVTVWVLAGMAVVLGAWEGIRLLRAR